MSAIPSIRELFEAGYLSSLDYHLAEALERIAGEEDPLIALATAVACRATTNGHVCADLESLVSTSLLDGSGDPIPGASWPDLARWLPALRESRLVTDGDSLSPLVLENDQRLYLGRYWDLQRRLVGEIEARLALPPDSPDEGVLRQGIERLFAPGADEPDWQKAAAVAALRNNFTVISGGPGTGKTTTIVKILVLLFEQALNAGSPPCSSISSRQRVRPRPALKNPFARLDPGWSSRKKPGDSSSSPARPCIAGWATAGADSVPSAMARTTPSAPMS